MNTVISQVQARNSLVDFDINDFLSSTDFKERVTEFQHDPLVLACSLKNLLEKQDGYYQLDDIRVIENITPEIEEQAEDVRKYYTKKFFWSALSNNQPLSDYRRRLINLLENRIRSCKDQDCGIYYKLPFFYEEDLVYEDFKKTYKVDADIAKIIYSGSRTKEQFELVYLKSTFSTQRKRKIERFWFTDNTHLFQIELDKENPLLEMFRVLLEKDPTISLEGFRTVDRIDQMHFYKLYKFNFKKD